MRHVLVLIVMLAGCVGPAPTLDEPVEAPDVEPAPVSRTSQAAGSCATPLTTTPRGTTSESVLTLERPEDLASVEVVLDWDAVVVPGVTMGMMVAPPGTPPFPEHAWVVADGADPLVVNLTDEDWPATASKSLEVTIYAANSQDGAEDTAAIYPCTWSADVTMTTQAGRDGDVRRYRNASAMP